MSLSMKLEVRQSQSLSMTPQLLQSIRLLQYGHLDLQAFVEREAERNPLLVVEERDGPPVAPASGALAAPASPFTAQRRESPRERGVGDPGGAGFDMQERASGRPSLLSHALGEIAELLSTPLERKIAEALLADFDEAGYLRVDVPAAAQALGVPTDAVHKVLTRLRAGAEPAGLFAGDLAECLALQLARKDRLDPVIRTVLDHLDLLARRDFAALRRLTGEDEAGLLDMLAEIRALDPKPGLSFEADLHPAIEPDVLVTRAATGGWRVELNGAVLPRVLLDADYVRTVTAECRSPAEKEFLGACQTSATWLLRSLDQRAQTILKVAAEIVRRQEAFLDEGVGGLKPMTLAAVAQAVGLHESTVSRVTADKTVETPRGVFEMKFFFTVAIASSTGGEAHSAASVKHRIRLLVEAESAGSVLSDDEIAARLKDEGVELARRTVAKYREALGIASSVQRRREMNARKIAS
ncbi:RNA polymerase factor sigma-54 [Aureimonas populi]|uniref:RNA polymerase sigma-54 factor n=1 Tax=Aureimonas populi TaxID=1701758 RepID=A0ABW5CPV9_9HYPH|nr:RNA polymerase factor sigma-54 [Aureimonas populi]